MANLIMAPVWSLGWKVALIILLVVAVIVCIIAIVLAIIFRRRRKQRAAKDNFEIPDDGGFSKIVRADDYNVNIVPAQGTPAAPDIVTVGRIPLSPAISYDAASGLPTGVPAGSINPVVFPVAGVIPPAGMPMAVDPATGLPVAVPPVPVDFAHVGSAGIDPSTGLPFGVVPVPIEVAGLPIQNIEVPPSYTVPAPSYAFPAQQPQGYGTAEPKK